MENKDRFIIVRCKREEYIKAWVAMYKADKQKFNDSIFDGINPMLNKVPLKTEIDNFCTVIYDSHVKDSEKGFGIDSKEGFKYGKPVGIFSFIITENKGVQKIIGKQFVVNPDYQRMGLGKALLLENEKTLLENGYDKYYIGCSKMSAGIMKSFGTEPYSSDIEHDLFKFNIDLNRENFNEQYKKFILDNNSIKTIN